MILNKISSIPLYLQIFAGMIAGACIGATALYLNGEALIHQWVRPWGQLFIRLLQLIAIPLVFISLVKGITELRDVGRFSRLGGRVIALYMMTTVFAVLVGLSMGLIVKPGTLVNPARIAPIQERYLAMAEEKKNEVERTQEQGPLAFLNDLIPGNIIQAAADNSKMLQMVFFAVFFGVAALSIAPEKMKPVIVFFDGLNDIILRMIDCIIRIAPGGVMALMAGLVVDFKGDASIFNALGVYAVTVALSLLFLLLVFYPSLVHWFTRKKAKDFLKAMYPVQLFAFTTSSSAATLPVTMEVVEKQLHVSKESAAFVLPIGMTINMDGTSCYQTLSVLFIAQALGVTLGWQQLLVIIGMTVLSSIGTPAVPGGSYVVLAMVLTSVGIPAEGIALILGIDRPLDMLRTAVNVTGDAAVATLIDAARSH